MQQKRSMHSALAGSGSCKRRDSATPHSARSSKVCKLDDTPIVSGSVSPLLVYPQSPLADSARSGAAGNDPGLLAPGSAHLPSRHRRLRDPIPRIPDIAVHHRRRQAASHGDGSRVRLKSRQELPGLFWQRHRPARGRRDVLGWNPAFAGAAVLGLRGSAQRRDAGQAPEGALGCRKVHLAVHKSDLHHTRRRPVRNRVRLARLLAAGPRVSLYRSAARSSELVPERAHQVDAEDHCYRDDGTGWLDDGVTAKHWAGEKSGARRSGSGSAQRHYPEDSQSGAQEGEVHPESELHTGYDGKSAAHRDSVHDALPDLHAEDYGRPVLLAPVLLVFHLWSNAGARQHHQRLSGDGSLVDQFPEDSRDPEGSTTRRSDSIG